MATINVPFPTIASTGANSIVALPAISAGLSGSLVAELHVSPAEGNTAAIHVIDTATGIKLKTLEPLPTNGQGAEFCEKSGDGDEDGLNPARFSIQFDGAGDHAEGYAVVR